MSQKVKIEVDGKTFELPLVIGTEGEKAVDPGKGRDRYTDRRQTCKMHISY